MKKTLLANLILAFILSCSAINATPLTERKSVYLAAGWGYPQGGRGELGYKFERILTLGLTFGIGDSWSNDSWTGSIGYIAKIRITRDSSSLTPYLSFNQGTTISIFGGPDSYSVLMVGISYPVVDWLLFQPEVGLVFTEKHISGGDSIFGDSPEVRKEQTWLGVHLNFEIDFARMY